MLMAFASGKITNRCRSPHPTRPRRWRCLQLHSFQRLSLRRRRLENGRPREKSAVEARYVEVVGRFLIGLGVIRDNRTVDNK